MDTSSQEGRDKRRREILNKLSPKAKPFNSAWRRLEDLGFTPDYHYGMDEGEEPRQRDD